MKNDILIERLNYKHINCRKSYIRRNLQHLPGDLEEEARDTIRNWQL